MRTYIGDQEALNALEFQELACGFGGAAAEDFEELFHGHPGESAEERDARLAVARDVLAELHEQRHADEIALLNARYAARLSSNSLFRSKAVPAGKPTARRAA